MNNAMDDLYTDYYGKGGKFDKFDNETNDRLREMRSSFAKKSWSN